MEEIELKKLIHDFIVKQDLAVLSTVTQDAKPEAAVIRFAATDTLELIFETFSTYRKYTNFQYNSHVALVIGWDKNITVQYEGNASELQGEECEQYKQVYFAKNPQAQKWETRAEIRFFEIIPTWIRYSNLNTNPWEIHEINL